MEDRGKNIDTCDKLGVALVKELCPICCKEMDGPIIMNQRLSRVQKEKVESLHNKVIGFSEHCCDECKKLKDKVVYFIEAVPQENKPTLQCRTGSYWGIKKDTELVKKLREMGYVTHLGECEAIFLDTESCIKLGLKNA